MKKLLSLVALLGFLGVGGVYAAQAPSITSISPTSGTTAGGTSITISGTHLDNVSVTIGGNAATSVTVAPGAQSLTAVTPSGTAGAKDVVVVNTNGTSTLAGGFTFVAPPHTLTYSAGVNGSLTGSTTQIVANGGSGTAVTAVPVNQWFTFSNWSDGSTQNPRTDTNVTADLNVTANFASSQSASACNGSTFDNFATGTVNGQNGWSVSGDDDQEIVPNTFGQPTFGCKSLRISDATTSVFIFNQVFSATTTHEAGETDAVSNLDFPPARDNHFDAQFDLASVTTNEQPGMHLSVSPDRGDGTRMSSLGFVDNASGIDVFFDDVTGTTSPVSFHDTQIASSLSRGVPHTIRYSMDFLDGPSNDVVKVYIDGQLVHTGTSWENFYRYDASAYPAPNGKSRTVKSLVFYEPNPAHTANKWGGYLVDNVSLSTSNVATSTGTTTNAFPVITLNGSSTMNINLNSTWTDPGATATDAEDGTLTVTATGTVNTAVTGTYNIMYSATDSANQTATTSRTVNVVATSTNATSTPSGTSTPVIVLNGDATMQVLQGATWTDPGATAHDTASSSLTVTATGTVNTNVLGNYTITYSTTGSNNAVATTTRTVQVVSSVSTSTPGSGGGSVSSGGGYFVYAPLPGTNGNGLTTIAATTTLTNPVNITLLPLTGNGQVLGVSTVRFTRNLKLGMTGDDILALQTLLKTGGYLTISVPTNYFGGKTLAALKKWQKAHKLPVTGFFGPASRMLLNNQ